MMSINSNVEKQSEWFAQKKKKKKWLESYVVIYEGGKSDNFKIKWKCNKVKDGKGKLSSVERDGHVWQ